MVPIFILFWGVTEFQDTYHGFFFYTLYFFLFFFVDSYIAGARETQEDTL